MATVTRLVGHDETTGARYLQCTRCGFCWPEDRFYDNKNDRTGKQRWCKECNKNRSREVRQSKPEWTPRQPAMSADEKREKRREWRANNRDKVLAQKARYRARHREALRRKQREYMERNYDSAKMTENSRRTRARHPEKYKARTAVSNALRDGRLAKPDTCSRCECGSEDRKIEAHHEDYSKPLHVVWLCSVCHGEEHRRS